MEKTTDLPRSRSGYEKLAIVSSNEISEVDETATGKRPMQLFRSKTTTGSGRANAAVAAEVKSHPIFSLADARRRKKAMKNPDFMRYMQYLKEAGTWDSNSNTPSIYFK